MSSWVMHLITATEISKNFDIDEDCYLLGNVIPDAYVGYVVKDMSQHVDYDTSHYTERMRVGRGYRRLPNAATFERRYQGLKENPVLLGYLSHLATDYFWNQYSFSKHYQYNEEGKVIGICDGDGKFKSGDAEFARIAKQGDFKVFSDYLLDHTKLEVPHKKSKLIEYSSKLKEAKVEETDIEKILEHLEKIQKKETEVQRTSYQMFQKEELKQKLQESINFVSKYMERIMKEN